VAVWFFAFCGVYSQLSSGFSLSFPYNILLLPFSILEWFLMLATSQ